MAIGCLVFIVCSLIVWALSMRFFASWNDACFQEGPGWGIGMVELVRKGWWTSDLVLASVAPFLPYLVFVGPKQSRTRQTTMIGAMLCTVATLYLVGGPATLADCDTKGPFPEIGYLLFGMAISLPLALGLAWLTQLRRTVG